MCNYLLRRFEPHTQNLDSTRGEEKKKLTELATLN